MSIEFVYVPHSCNLTGLKTGIPLGTVVKCTECGQEWEYVSDSYVSGRSGWERSGMDDLQKSRERRIYLEEKIGR